MKLFGLKPRFICPEKEDPRFPKFRLGSLGIPCIFAFAIHLLYNTFSFERSPSSSVSSKVEMTGGDILN